jgi:Carbohydrate esterase, sialic acid-specific acetylesterase
MGYRLSVVAATICLLLSGCGLQEHARPATPPATTPPVGVSPPSSTPPPPSVALDAAPPAPGSPPGAPPGAPPRDGGPGATPKPLDAAPAGSPPADAAASVPPPSGAFVDINGVRIPREKALVFIHYGHSNMAGRGINPVSLRPLFYDVHPRIWSYQDNGQFVPAREPTAPDGGVGAGPGMAWLKAAAAAAGPDYYFISVAKAQGSATTAQFVKGGLYYSTFMDRAVRLKGKVTFAGVFIMMGITDRHMPLAEQGGFADRTVQIIADIRADLGEPNLPILHTDYEVTATGALAVTADLGVRMRPLMLSLPQRISNLAIVPTDQITLEDDHHFTLAGHKLWAERGMKIMIDRGWFPFTQ